LKKLTLFLKRIPHSWGMSTPRGIRDPNIVPLEFNDLHCVFGSLCNGLKSLMIYLQLEGSLGKLNMLTLCIFCICHNNNEILIFIITKHINIL
jgi:hypothetical protein